MSKKKDKIFVDTNIFLRFLMNEDIEITDKIEIIFKKAEKGTIKLITNSFVIIEIVFVLESYYGKTKLQIESMVLNIINTKGLEVEGYELLINALGLYANKNIDFIDVYNAFYMKENKLDKILSLDKKHFSRVDWINIMEI